MASSTTAGEQPHFKCPKCKKVSYHPADRKHGYCGACKLFTGTGEDDMSLPEIEDLERRNFQPFDIVFHVGEEVFVYTVTEDVCDMMEQQCLEDLDEKPEEMPDARSIAIAYISESIQLAVALPVYKRRTHLQSPLVPKKVYLLMSRVDFFYFEPEED